MRLTADLVRWGIAVLLMAPFLAIGGWALGVTPLLWLALIAVVAGGALNAVGVIRGVRRVADGRVVDDLLGQTDARLASSTSAPVEPRQRLIFPDEPAGVTPEQLATGSPLAAARRRAALGAALGLFALTLTGLALVTAVMPWAASGGALSPGAIYTLWGGFAVLTLVGIAIWTLLGFVAAAAIWLTGRVEGPFVRRLASPRRTVALACIMGAALVVGWLAPAALPGLTDALGGAAAVPGAAPWRAGFGSVGVLLSCAAIAATIPRWGWRARR